MKAFKLTSVVMTLSVVVVLEVEENVKDFVVVIFVIAVLEVVAVVKVSVEVLEVVEITFTVEVVVEVEFLVGVVVEVRGVGVIIV